jgi:thiamine biosynthesis lipoprotein
MMKRKAVLLFILTVLFSGCNFRKPVFDSFAGFTQGTTYSMVYDNQQGIDPVELKSKVEQLLFDFDQSLSLYRDSSLISKINRNEKVAVDSFFTEVYNLSTLISGMTDGAFDITVGSLVKAWGFGPDEKRNFTEAKHDSLMRYVGMEKVSLVDGYIIKTDTGVSLDLNAIAQGFSVDVVCRLFDEMGIRSYLIEIGGEVKAKGTKAGSLWRIGIDKPEDYNMSPGQNLQAIIELEDKSIATSGNYRKFYVEDGIKYSHTINPKTGYPAKNRLLSATIVADDCGMADGIATACMVMGIDKAIEFINQHPQFSAYFVFSDNEGNFNTWISESLKDFISEPESE